MSARDLTATAFALAGFTGAANPHCYSSPAWYAHRIGEHLQATGRSTPRDVRMGRGYRVRVADMIFDGDTLERLQ